MLDMPADLLDIFLWHWMTAVRHIARLTRVDLFLNLLLALGEQKELETENRSASTSVRPWSFPFQSRIHAEEILPSKHEDVPIRRVHDGV